MCHAKQRLKKYTIFSLVHYRVCYLEKYFFGPSRKAFNLRFCPVYITVTSSPSVLEWAWHKHQVLSRISGGFGLVSWTKHLFHVWQLYKMDSFFIFFLTQTCEQHKKDFLVLKLFVYFFRRVSSLAETSAGTITTNIEQHIKRIRVPKNDFQWKWMITETCCKPTLQETSRYERYTQALFRICDRKTWWNQSCLPGYLFQKSTIVSWVSSKLLTPAYRK